MLQRRFQVVMRAGVARALLQKQHTCARCASGGAIKNARHDSREHHACTVPIIRTQPPMAFTHSASQA